MALDDAVARVPWILDWGVIFTESDLRMGVIFTESDLRTGVNCGYDGSELRTGVPVLRFSLLQTQWHHRCAEMRCAR